MFNTDFNPYDAIVELQQIQHLQAENMLKVSDWMMEVSVAGTNQTAQITSLFKLVETLNNQLKLLDKRIVLLERHLLASINNTSSETQVPVWDL